MACCMRDVEKERRARNSERASPGVKEILLKLYRSESPTETDHHLYEFGYVEYHIKCSVSDAESVYLSISTPILSQGISSHTLEMVESICPGVVEIVEPPTLGFHLTLRLLFANLPKPKESTRMIAEIAAVQSVIASSQLREIFRGFNVEDQRERMPKPIKLAYHPREPFFIIRQSEKIIALLPMRFKETTDVIIATSFFQELMDVGNSEEWEKVPRCTWSPIPPLELRGESIEDLSTNGGFISFDILSRHIEEKRLDKTVWNILNFYAYVKSHVKCTKGFIQRRLRKRMEDMVKALHQTTSNDSEPDEKFPGCGYAVKLKSSSKLKKFRRRCGDFSTKIRRVRYKIKIRGFGHLRRRWFSLSKITSNHPYMRLE